MCLLNLEVFYMIRGFRFNSNAPEEVFVLIESLKNQRGFQWVIDDLELNHYEVSKGVYDNSEFRDAVSDLSFLSFARLRRYLISSDIEEIDTYQDFFNSDCDFLVLFYDGGIFEIYSKLAEKERVLFEQALSNEVLNIGYITDENDERFVMHF